MKHKLIKTMIIFGAIVSLAACQEHNVISSSESNSVSSESNNSSSQDKSSSQDSSSSENHETRVYEGVNQLRSPTVNPNSFDYQTYGNNDNYLAFKSKIQSFSHRLSEAFVKDQYDENKNITISPLSIEMCLGLATYAANGVTRQELLDALGVDFETLNTFYKPFFEQFNITKLSNMDDLASQLLLTNSIWIDKDVEYIDQGLDDLKNNYCCYSYEADFDGHNKDSNDAIKDFIYEQTKGLINPEMNLSPATLFVLLNTLYLKDVWNEGGNSLSYTPQSYPFTNGDGQKVRLNLLMGNFCGGKVIETDDFSSFYTSTDHDYKIYFIKPNEGKTISKVFNKENMAYVLNKNNYVTVDHEKRESYLTRCFFPEYQADCNLDLKKLFIDNFNVKSLFDKNGSLTNVCKTPAYVEDFRHIAKLAVDKKGIEGAAVTYMAYAGAAASEYKEVRSNFIIDKEFGFILTNAYNDVIFSGVVSNLKQAIELPYF